MARTGFSLAVGCMHRYSGAVNTSAHLQNTVALLSALAQDSSQQVQLWALHALILTIDSAGYEFRSHVAATVTLCAQVLHGDSSGSVRRSAGDVINALITTLGPELQMEDQLRTTFLLLLDDMLSSAHAAVQLSALEALQQMTIYCPKAVSVPKIMSIVQIHVTNQHLQLRHAAVVILKQLAQRQPEAVMRAGSGIERVVFRMLDGEDDARMQVDLRDVITEFLSTLAEQNPSHWLVLCNSVLSGATEKESQVI